MPGSCWTRWREPRRACAPPTTSCAATCASPYHRRSTSRSRRWSPRSRNGTPRFAFDRRFERTVDLLREGYDVALRAALEFNRRGLIGAPSGATRRSPWRPPNIWPPSASHTVKDLRKHRCLTAFARGELPQSTWPVGRGAVHVESVLLERPPRFSARPRFRASASRSSRACSWRSARERRARSRASRPRGGEQSPRGRLPRARVPAFPRACVRRRAARLGRAARLDPRKRGPSRPPRSRGRAVPAAEFSSGRAPPTRRRPRSRWPSSAPEGGFWLKASPGSPCGTLLFDEATRQAGFVLAARCLALPRAERAS